MKNTVTYHVIIANKDGEFIISPHSGLIFTDYDEAFETFMKIGTTIEHDRILMYRYMVNGGYTILF